MKTLLDRVRAFLESRSLDSGYSVRYNRWTDKQLDGNTPFIVLRVETGAGLSSELLQQTDVKIQVVQNVNQTGKANTRMELILQAFRSTDTPDGLVRCGPVGTMRGPFYLDNKRPMYELTVRCVSEDL